MLVSADINGYLLLTNNSINIDTLDVNHNSWLKINKQ